MAASDNYSPGKEQVQVTAAPNISTVQARFDTAPTDTLGQLARALNIAAPAAENAVKTYEAVETVKGTQAANGMTLEEQRKMIANKQLMESNSSAYVATVQHMYGQNSMDRAKRETLDGIAKGTLSFPDAASLEKHITDLRNTALAGQSKFTIAGYDKGLDAFTSSAGAANAEKVNKDYVTSARVVRNDHTNETILRVTAKDFIGTDAEKSAEILKSIALPKDTGVLPIEEKKDALQSIVNALAGAGNTPLLATVLNSDSGGHRVSSIIGGAYARQITMLAESADHKVQSERVNVELRTYSDAAYDGNLTGGKLKAFEDWVTTNEKYVTTEGRRSILNAQRAAVDRLERQNASGVLNAEIQRTNTLATTNIATALRAGEYASLGQQYVINSSGQEVVFDSKAFATKEIPNIVAEKKLSENDEMNLWATADVQNPKWKSIIGAGISNLASVGRSADGKAVGLLSSQGKESMELYQRLHTINHAVAEDYAGKDAKLMSDIMFSQSPNGGGHDLQTAAGIVQEAANSGIDGKISEVNKRAIKASAADLTSSWNPVYNTDFAASLRGDDVSNSVHNTEQIAADVVRRAGILVQRGASEKDAIAAAIEYVKDPKITSVVNGTVYYNANLPRTQEPEGPGFWFKRFIAEGGPKDIAAAAGFDASKVRLEPNTFGGYTAWLGGVPLTKEGGGMVSYQRKDVESWITETAHQGVVDRAAAQTVAAFRDRMLGTTFKGLFKQGPFQKYQTNVTDELKFEGKYLSMNQVTSKENWTLLKADGLTQAPVEDILRATLNYRKK